MSRHHPPNYGSFSESLVDRQLGHKAKFESTIKHLAVLQINLNVGQNLNEDEGALAMNLTPVYEQWRKETLQEGRQEGIRLGLQQRERSLILRQLSHQVGNISPEVSAKVEGLSLP